jgi:hypothetical protein
MARLGSLFWGDFMDSGGISFGSFEAEAASPIGTAAGKKRSGGLGRLRRAIHVLGIGLLVAAASMACLMALSWIRSQGAVAAVQAQVQDLRVGRVEEAYSLFSTSYRAGVSLPMFRRWLRHEERLGKAQNLEFWGRSVWGETAVLWGSFQDDLGHSVPVRYLLVREKGAWKIDGFHLSSRHADSSPDTVHFIQI